MIDDAEPEKAVEAATEVLEGFKPHYDELWLSGMRTKLGLQNAPGGDDEDLALAQDWLDLLEKHKVDFTLGWHRLADAAEGNTQPLAELFSSSAVPGNWLERWQQRVDQDAKSKTAEAMRAVNPVYIPRNHLVEEALAAATDEADLSLFAKLLDVLLHPYEEQPGFENYMNPAPQEFTSCYKTFCGT